jgi:hypothetical protein
MTIKKQFARAVDKIATYALTNIRVDPLVERALALHGAIAAAQQKSIQRVERLSDVEFSVFSQWGEDGIIEWLIHNNGDMPETFIEFGVEDYRESNTRFLLMHRNWRGLAIDGSEVNIARARADQISWRQDLTTTAAFITKENINQLIIASGLIDEIGILSVDIDGNDYWVWQAINCIKPQIVIAEYNSAFGDLLPLSIPYAADFYRKNAHYSNLYYGAAIGALKLLARQRGYTMLGSNRAGSNVFFVRDDRLSKFEGRIANRAVRPSRFREARNAASELTFVRGVQRSEVIAELPVVDVTSGVSQPLRMFGSLYSAEWLAALGA